MRHDKNTCVGCTDSRTHRITRHVASSIYEKHHSSGDHIITLIIIRVSSTLSDSSAPDVPCMYLHTYIYIPTYLGIGVSA